MTALVKINGDTAVGVPATLADGSRYIVPAVTLADSAGNSVPAGGTTDPFYNRIQGSATLATAQVSVNTTATLIAAARSGRNAITVTNITGAQQVFIGATAGVTTATGTLLPATVGASITLPYAGAVYGIASTAAQTVSVAETY